MRSMKSSLLRVMIGSVLFIATHGGSSPAQAALVTQLDISGGSVDLSFGSLGHVGGTFDRDGLLVLGQYLASSHVFSPVAVGPRTFSIFTSGLGRDPVPTGQASGATLAVNLRSLFPGVMHIHALNIGGFATGVLDLSTDGFLLSWSHDVSGSGVPFPQSGAFSLHGRAQAYPLSIPPAPASVILFGAGLFGIVGVVVRRDTNGKGQRDKAFAREGGRGEPFGQVLILLVSSDGSFAKEIQEHLARSGYATHVVSSVSDGSLFARQRSPALTLLDQRLSDWDSLRTDTNFRHVPMMILVPTGIAYRDDDWISDLERGVDGIHLCQEGHKLLLAKVGTYLRRAGYVTSKRGVYRAGAVELDSDLHEVKIGSHRLQLSAKPFALLEAFMMAPSMVLSRSELINYVWGPGFAIGDHALDVHVHMLRRQLDRNPDHRCQLITIKGVGFKLKSLSPAMLAPSVPDVQALAASAVPLLPSGKAHVSNTQQSRTPLTPEIRRIWLRRVPRHRRARLIRRKTSVRHPHSAAPVA